jgi:hypothetical protein
LQHAIGKYSIGECGSSDHGAPQRELLFADMDTADADAGGPGQKKKAAFSRGLLELFRHSRCRENPS